MRQLAGASVAFRALISIPKGAIMSERIVTLKEPITEFQFQKVRL